MATVLNTYRKKIEIKLPKTGGTVWLWNELLAGDFREMMGKTQITQDMTINAGDTFSILIKLIADWDFVNENNEKLPITQENIDLLPIKDLTKISEQVSKISGELTEDVKKNTNKNSI